MIRLNQHGMLLLVLMQSVVALADDNLLPSSAPNTQPAFPSDIGTPKLELHVLPLTKPLIRNQGELQPQNGNGALPTPITGLGLSNKAAGATVNSGNALQSIPANQSPIKSIGTDAAGSVNNQPSDSMKVRQDATQTLQLNRPTRKIQP